MLSVQCMLARMTCPWPQCLMAVDRLSQLLVLTRLLGADWLSLWFLHCPGPAVKLFLGFVAGRPLWGSCPLYLGIAPSTDWQSNCSCRWRGA